jgi:hypothetical protein
MITRSQRASSIGIGLVWLLAPIAPDGLFDHQDRQHSAVSYSGIPSEFPSIVEIYVDDILFPHPPVSIARAGVTVHLLSTTGNTSGHMRFMRQSTVEDLATALIWIAANWIPEPET